MTPSEPNGAGGSGPNHATDLAGRYPDRHPKRYPSSATGAEGPGATLRTFLRALRRRLPVMLICLAVVPVAALGWSLQQSDEYESSASVLFRDVELGQLEGLSISDFSEDPTRAAETNVRLIATGEVAADAAKRIDAPGLTAADVEAAVDVSLEGESEIASISATAEDPQLAAEIANAFAAAFVDYRSEADQRIIGSARNRLEASLARLTPEEAAGLQGERIREQIDELGLLASLQTSAAEVVQGATANPSPTSPKPARNTVLGLLLGGLLGIGIVLLLEQFDTRIRDESELEQTYDLPILTSVPHSSAVHPVANDPIGLGPPAAEAFRMLHANLRFFNVGRRIDSLVITSAAAREGKTTVSWGLAVSEARSGKSVLLIEADMRKPTLAARLNQLPAAGLSQVLAESESLDLATNRPAIESEDPIANLEVLFAGPPPPNPAELLESERMSWLLEEARTRYDLIVLDTPPTVVADAIPLMRQASGVIVVSRLGETRREPAGNLHDLLTHLEAVPLGIVANDTTPKTGDYYMPYASGRSNVPT